MTYILSRHPWKQGDMYYLKERLIEGLQVVHQTLEFHSRGLTALQFLDNLYHDLTRGKDIADVYVWLSVLNLGLVKTLTYVSWSRRA
jgi:hypothetical protein